MLFFNNRNITQPYYENQELNVVVMLTQDNVYEVNTNARPFNPHINPNNDFTKVVVWCKPGYHLYANLKQNLNITTRVGIQLRSTNDNGNFFNWTEYELLSADSNNNGLYIPVVKRIKQSLNPDPTTPDAWYSQGDRFYVNANAYQTFRNAFSMLDSSTLGGGAIMGCLNFLYVTNMNGTFKDCSNASLYLKEIYNVIDMSEAYYNCNRFNGIPSANAVCNSVRYMDSAFYNCANIRGNAVLPANLISASNAYVGAKNLTGIVSYGTSYQNLDNTFNGCNLITGDAYTATNMAYAYYGCSNLNGNIVNTGSPINMRGAFFNCSNIVNIPEEFNDVIDASLAFYDCMNINVNNITFGDNIKNLDYAFYNAADKLSGNMYITADPPMENGNYLVVSGLCMFGGQYPHLRQYYTPRLNIFVKPNSKWYFWLRTDANYISVSEHAIERWSADRIDYNYGKYCVDTMANVYLYHDSISENINVPYQSFSQINNDLVDFAGLTYATEEV